jgi:hypothetical protein
MIFERLEAKNNLPIDENPNPIIDWKRLSRIPTAAADPHKSSILCSGSGNEFIH